jgi:Fe-S oxidoreductase
LIGCAYVIGAPGVAADIVGVVERLVGTVELLGECCGAPLRSAGDHEGYLAAQESLLKRAGSRRLVVADPGCAAAFECRPSTIFELVDAERHRLFPLRDPPRPARYHDPCHLARGLGVVDAPRRILERVLGEPPREFSARGAEARCSGAGGLVPLVMPRVSRRIADARLDEHRRLGGGTLVTACGASLRRFQSRGAPAVDLMSLVRKSLEAR